MRKIRTEEIEQAVYELAKKACLNLTPDCVKAIENAAISETGESAKFSLDTILENARIAAREHMPVCQDTGMSVILYLPRSDRMSSSKADCLRTR